MSIYLLSPPIYSLIDWRAIGRSAVWLYVDITQSSLIPVAAECGFSFHHAELNNAALVLWLDDKCPSRIPSFASHQVGVGG